MKTFEFIAGRVGVLSLLGWALGFASPAFAARVVDFNVAGTNHFFSGLVISSSQPECRIMIVNAGSTSQNVTISFTGTAAGVANGTMIMIYGGSQSTLANPLADGPRTLTASGTATDSLLYQWWPPAIPAAASSDTDMRCTGTITVDDAASGVSGFVIATGQMTTFQEASAGMGTGAGGGTSKTVTTSPNTAPIVIGEGRPF